MELQGRCGSQSAFLPPIMGLGAFLFESGYVVCIGHAPHITMKVISKGTFKDIIAILMWVSQDTLDRDRLLTKEEYVEAARKICDYCGLDYYTKAAEEV